MQNHKLTAESPETGNPKIKPQKKNKSRFKSVLQPYASRNGVTQNTKTLVVHREIKYYPCKKYIAPKHSSSVSVPCQGLQTSDSYNIIQHSQRLAINTVLYF